MFRPKLVREDRPLRYGGVAAAVVVLVACVTMMVQFGPSDPGFAVGASHGVLMLVSIWVLLFGFDPNK
jgi:hypothetical protein